MGKRMRVKAFLLAVGLLAAGVLSLAGCGDGGGQAEAYEGERPDTWIADRKITVRTFNTDTGIGLPDDQINNAVAQEIKRLTGITMEIIYTPGTVSLESLTTAIAVGDLPDAINYYLEDSTRPEYPIVLKAAREGMFVDVAPYLKETSVYGKYYEEGYLPADSYSNILQRPEFGGATYHVHMRIPRSPDTQKHELRTGMYIQTSIVEALGINPRTDVTTQEELYALLKKIKAGGFTDAYGNPVTPLGPAYWGGSMREFAFNGYMPYWEYTEDGQVIHQIQTNSCMDQIMFARKLLAEGLVHKEFFTMDSARAAEGALSYSFAIVEDIHSGMLEEFFNKVDYVPLGPLENRFGQYYEYKAEKNAWGAWSIPKGTKNPEEIVKFADFMASRQGKLLWQYGIEGVHYDLVDGNPVVKAEVLQKAAEDASYLRNENIWGGGVGSMWGAFFGETDLDNLVDFGEIGYGEATQPDKYAKQEYLNSYLVEDKPFEKTIYTSGFAPDHYLAEYGVADLTDMLSFKSYAEEMGKAIFASSDEEARRIMETYLQQVLSLGLEEFEAQLAGTIKENPKLVNIRSRSE